MVLVALISGVLGQDGSYLAELLLSKNYYVWGITRKSHTFNTINITNILNHPNLRLEYGDMIDGSNLLNLLMKIKEYHTDLEKLEIYNLAALSHVGVSFELPEYCVDVNGVGTLRFLEAIRMSGYSDKIKFYQASTSELFGKVRETPQNENTPFYPRSPYGVAKLYAFWITKNYREAYGLFSCNGILFNHESPRRDAMFVTRKITKGLNEILQGKIKKLGLGNLDAKRDWGHAKDYVYGMWLMLQQDTPDDFVLSTGQTCSVREFVEKAFKLKGITIHWKGSGLNEIGYDANTNQELIFVDPKYLRPAEVEILLGDSSKAFHTLGWSHKYTLDDLVQEMVAHDCGSPSTYPSSSASS